MKYFSFILIFIFGGFAPYERKPTNREFREINMLLHKVQHKAMEGTLDKELIKKWLIENE